MANSLTFRANVWQSRFLLYQEGVTLDAGNTSETSVVVTFPSGNTLEISKAAILAQTRTIEQWNSDADQTYWANIKKDLKRWGWATTPEASTYLCMIDMDLLTNEEYFPGGSLTQYFDYEDPDGFDLEFPTIDELYDGVYKFTSTVNVFDSGASPVEDLIEIRRVISVAKAENAIASYVDDYFTKHADESITKQSVDEVRDLTMKLMMLEYAARYDFARNKYTAANEKITALETALNTGIFTYKPGS